MQGLAKNAKSPNLFLKTDLDDSTSAIDSVHEKIIIKQLHYFSFDLNQYIGSFKISRGET
jgi:hypothetical protein